MSPRRQPSPRADLLTTVGVFVGTFLCGVGAGVVMFIGLFY